MRYYTHIAVSVTAVHLLGDALPATVSLEAPAAVAGLLIGSVLPDIDETRSWLGRRIPVLSTLVKMLFGHRGLTHSGLVLLLMGVGMMSVQSEFFQALFIGVILHIAADFFSAGGIPLLYPFSRKRSQIALYRTGSWSEHLIFAAAIAYWAVLFL